MAIGSLISTTGPADVGVSAEEYQKTLGGMGLPNPTLDLNSEYDYLIGQSASVASQMMAGYVPDDVQRQTRQMSLEKSYSSGAGVGSQASRNIVARDLGLQSLNLVTTGQKTAMDIATFQESKRATSLDTLTKQRQLDISSASLKEDSRRANLQAQLDLQEMLLKSVATAHELQIRAYEADMGDEATSLISEDFANLTSSLRSLLGEEVAPAPASGAAGEEFDWGAYMDSSEGSWLRDRENKPAPLNKSGEWIWRSDHWSWSEGGE